MKTAAVMAQMIIRTVVPNWPSDRHNDARSGTEQLLLRSSLNRGASPLGLPYWLPPPPSYGATSPKRLRREGGRSRGPRRPAPLARLTRCRSLAIVFEIASRLSGVGNGACGWLLAQTGGYATNRSVLSVYSVALVELVRVVRGSNRARPSSAAPNPSACGRRQGQPT